MARDRWSIGPGRRGECADGRFISACFVEANEATPTPKKAADVYLDPMTFDFCIPTKATTVPNTPDWLHEVKYDGYRLRLERDGDRVRLITRTSALSCCVDQARGDRGCLSRRSATSSWRQPKSIGRGTGKKRAGRDA